MRENKYRAWNGEAMMLDLTMRANGYSEHAPIRLCSFPGYEFMQYTGLDDRKGTPVYEGDIIFFIKTYKDPELPKTAYMKVTFDRGCFWGENTDWQEPLFELIDGGEIEVIGNIFKNPEKAEELL